MELYFPLSMFNSMFLLKHLRKQCSREPALSASSRTQSAEPEEEWFPCCILAQTTVTITVWIFLMAFTFTLRFALCRGGTTCTLPDKSGLWGEEADSTGLCLEYSPLPAVLWMNGRTWWVSLLSCPVVVGNIDQSSWRMLKMKERMTSFGPCKVESLHVCPWGLSRETEWKGTEKGQFIM